MLFGLACSISDSLTTNLLNLNAPFGATRYSLYATAIALGLLLGQFCFLAVVSGLIEHSWSLSFLLGVSVLFFLATCLLGRTMIQTTEAATISWIVLGYMALPGALFCGGFPMLVARWFGDWHLTTGTYQPSQTNIKLSDLFLMTTVAATSVPPLSLLRSGWHDLELRYLVIGVPLASLALGFLVALPAAWLTMREKPVRIVAKVVIQCFFSVVLIGVCTFFGLENVLGLVVALATALSATIFVGLECLRRGGFRLRSGKNPNGLGNSDTTRCVQSPL